MTELPLESAKHLFINKTIIKMDVSSCNNIEFLFSDNTKVALHIDCDNLNLPNIMACTHCVGLIDETI